MSLCFVHKTLKVLHTAEMLLAKYFESINLPSFQLIECVDQQKLQLFLRLTILY